MNAHSTVMSDEEVLNKIGGFLYPKLNDSLMYVMSQIHHYKIAKYLCIGLSVVTSILWIVFSEQFFGYMIMAPLVSLCIVVYILKIHFIYRIRIDIRREAEFFERLMQKVQSHPDFNNLVSMVQSGTLEGAIRISPAFTNISAQFTTELSQPKQEI